MRKCLLLCMFHYVCTCVCLSHSASLADIQGESGSLIDWCWFHLGSEQRLTVDLSRCERQPLILVLFKQHVLIYVNFTKSAREERLPFYVWLFIEVGGGFLCTTPAACQHATYIVVAGCQRNEIPHLELKVINCQGNHLHWSAEESTSVSYILCKKH